jgi:hypothetical protein
MFCASGLVFGRTEGVRSLFKVSPARNRFRQYRGRRVTFSCFARPDSFSAVTRASGPIFMFCTPSLIFGGTEGLRSSFHVLSSRTCFQRCRVRRVPCSYFVRPDSFSAAPRVSGPVFMFYAHKLIFGGTEATGPVFMFCAFGLIFGGNVGVRSRFHVLRSGTRFQRYRGRRVPVYL